MEKLPLTMRPFYWLGKKSGLYHLLDTYGPSVGHFLDRNVIMITRLAELGGTGVAGYALGKLMYASTPEERGSALITLLPSMYITLCAGAVDLANGQVKRARRKMRSTLEELSSSQEGRS